MGAGSNLLVSDRGLPGLVITRHLRYTQFNPDTGEVRVAAGNRCRDWHGRQLSGVARIEWAVGIPAALVLLS